MALSVTAQERPIGMASTSQDGQDHVKVDREPSMYYSARIDGQDHIRVEREPSVYYSARIESMKESKIKFSSEVEFDIESSKVHWSELDSIFDKSAEHSPEADRKHFEMLMKHPSWGSFFREYSYLAIGKKIGEGAQADIYEALYKEYGFEAASGFWRRRTIMKKTESVHNGHVVKVMKEGFALRSLQQQWPVGMLSVDPRTVSGGPLQNIIGGTLLDHWNGELSNRFAFLMIKRWGDLRKLIDLQMLHKKQGPPFSTKQVKILMKYIAYEMHNLYQVYGILHRDLKAANVLICEQDHKHKQSLAEQKLSEKPLVGGFELMPKVMDFECSVGVVGTGFWRAPEILQQIKDKVSGCSLEFTNKADVYSYGMTCYEIVTGLIPFEGHPVNNYDLVLIGKRPELPHDLDPLVKGIIVSCWHHDPSQRPSFREILKKLFDCFTSLKEDTWEKVP